jgi:hypothetical protein
VSLAGLESLLYDSNFGPGGDRTEATTRKFVSAASDRSAGYCREDHDEHGIDGGEIAARHGTSRCV